FECKGRPGYYIGFNGQLEATTVPERHKKLLYAIQPGITGQPTSISLESSDFPGYFLRHDGFKIILENPGTNTGSFDKDATFWVKRGLWFPSHVTFESVNFPNHFIQNSNGKLKLSPFDGTDDYKANASFSLTSRDGVTLPGLLTTTAPVEPSPINTGCKYTQVGFEYLGNLSITTTGLTCQRWDKQSPHAHKYTDPSKFPDITLGDAQNYCRNPSNHTPGPWCHTTDDDVRWENCDVPYCDCRTSKTAREYNGEISKTRSGKTCQRWDSQSPHSHSNYDPSDFPEHSLSDASNFCRNPSSYSEGAWCYTTDPTVRWELCDIPVCDCKLSQFGRDFIGRVSVTSSGKTCQRWDSQSPHKHDKLDPGMFPDDSVADAGNYCRNPNNALKGPWCFTTDPNTETEYCTILQCG
ncbi:unnamed protein product, partial [Owenia fusiformis]